MKPNTPVTPAKTFHVDILKTVFAPPVIRAVLHGVFAFALGSFAHRDGFEYMLPGYITGCWAARQDYPWAFLGGIIGCLVSGALRPAFVLLIMAVLFAIWAVWQGAKNIKIRDRYMILAAALLISVAALDLREPALIFRGLISTALAILCAGVFHRGIHALNAGLVRRRMLDAYEQGAVSVFAGVVSFALSDITLLSGSVNIGAVFACMLGVIFINTDGIFGALTAVSAAFGAYAGADITHGLISCGVLGAAMVVGAGLGAKRRLPGALCCTAALLFLGSLLTEAFDPVQSLIGCVLGFLLSKPASRRLSSVFGNCRTDSAENPFTRLTVTAKLLDSLSVELQGYAGHMSGGMQESLLDANSRLSAVGDALYSTIESESAEDMRPKFSVFTGRALEPEDADDVSGDSVLVDITPQRALVVISDGMGTGSSAQAESAGFIELMRQLIGAGFEVPSAVNCANRLMIEGGLYGETPDDIEMYATADVFFFDRVTGEGLIVKQGAPPSFIVRGTRIITVYGEALPIGILGEAKPYTHSITLESNDWVVMLTDGVSDALGAHLIATITEILSKTPDPDTAAKELISAAHEVRLSPPDDMTAVFVRVE